MAVAIEDAEVVGLAYEAAANPALWSLALDGVARATGSRGALLPARTFVPGQLLHSSGMGDVLDQFFSEGWHERDLRTQAATPRVRRTEVVTDQNLLTEDEIAGSDYYRGFARMAGVPWFAASLLSVDADGYVALSLQRSAREGPFESADIGKLLGLMPHLRNAVALATALGRSHGRGLLEGLTLGGQAAALVDAAGQVVAINEGAQALLGSALNVRQGRLVAASPASQNRLSGLIAAAARPGDTNLATGPLVLEAPEGSPPLVVRVAPIMRSASDIFGFSGVLVMLMRHDARTSASPALLTALFGLTRQEAQILTTLGQGKSLTEIADEYGVTRETVRFHLKAIFTKTDTHRQSELVAMLARLGGFSA